MQSIVRALVEAPYEFMMALLICTNAKIKILTRQSFLDNKILSLMSDQLMQIFDGIYRS